MKLLIFKLLFGIVIFLSSFRTIFAQENYYFNDEFNLERPGGQLDSEKWVTYPNNTNCPTDTIREFGGFVTLKQCTDRIQFPYITSKNNPFPNANFSASIKFEYLKGAPWGVGIEFVDKAPENGAGFTQLFGLGFWEDSSSGLNMRLQFKGTVVKSIPINRNPHIFKLDKEESIYKMYLDNELFFTSPPTEEEVQAIYLGNPTIMPPPIVDWSWFRVDYIRITQTGPIKTIPEPFLDLPWKYSDSGKDFKQIVFDPNSWFDHNGPLQNYPSTTLGVLKFTGRFEDDHYKSHSGYDYASQQGVDNSTLVRASADGEASFVHKDHSHGAGNMIKIDHKNGYQTWYEHLEEATSGAELILKEEGATKAVKKGDILGRVGLTGNTTGYHIHLSVFKDINNNRDFSDDYPLGLTDPLGWEGNYTDPWEEYTIGSQHGAKSYKLFTALTPPTTQQIPPSGGTITKNNASVNVPDNASNEPLLYKIDFGPFEKASDTIKSILPSLVLTATNNSNQLITSFNNPLTLIYNYSAANLDNINEDTISFYYLNEQSNSWEKVSSILDKSNKTVAAPTNHFSQFAVMAELNDTTPPVTTAQITGNQGNQNWYLSDVTVSLLASDNPEGKGVSYSVYSLDGENWNEYKTPLEFKTEGNYKIYFLSHDKVGNTEEVKTIDFSIDKTPPEAQIFIDLDKMDLVVNPTDNDSQVIRADNPETKKKDDAIYTLTDPAGNTLKIDVRDRDKTKQDLFRIHSLTYNNNPPIPLPLNYFNILYKGKKEKLNIQEQSFKLSGETKIRIEYNPKKDQSTIITKDTGQEKIKETLPGLVLLKLQTNKNKLEYFY